MFQAQSPSKLSSWSTECFDTTTECLQLRNIWRPILNKKVCDATIPLFLGTFNFQTQSYYFRSGTSIFFNMTIEQQRLKTHRVGMASYGHNCYQYSSLQRLQRPLGTLQCCFPHHIQAYKCNKLIATSTIEFNCDFFTQLIQIITSIYVRLWTRAIKQGDSAECGVWT